jgi:hypothetical protein
VLKIVATMGTPRRTPVFRLSRFVPALAAGVFAVALPRSCSAGQIQEFEKQIIVEKARITPLLEQRRSVEAELADIARARDEAAGKKAALQDQKDRLEREVRVQAEFKRQQAKRSEQQLVEEQLNREWQEGLSGLRQEFATAREERAGMVKQKEDAEKRLAVLRQQAEEEKELRTGLEKKKQELEKLLQDKESAAVTLGQQLKEREEGRRVGQELREAHRKSAEEQVWLAREKNRQDAERERREFSLKGAAGRQETIRSSLELDELQWKQKALRDEMLELGTEMHTSAQDLAVLEKGLKQ